MPDAIVAFERHGRTFLVTANEGDSREYGDYEDAAALQADAALSRLEV